MTDDRELLALAAKACSLDMADKDIRRRWNPLHNDGDAFRLMVALDIDIRFYRKHVDAQCDSRAGSIFKEHGKDRAAATRNAIVMAAAEIGRGANKLRQAKGDGMNPKDFFSKYGREQIEIGCPWVTVEEMYQAFKARMMEELRHTSGQACKTPTTNNPKRGI